MSSDARELFWTKIKMKTKTYLMASIPINISKVKPAWKQNFGFRLSSKWKLI